jgi:hypothetical protein
VQNPGDRAEYVALDATLTVTNITDDHAIQIVDVRVRRRDVTQAAVELLTAVGKVSPKTELDPHKPTTVRCFVLIRRWSPPVLKPLDLRLVLVDQYSHPHRTAKIRFKPTVSLTQP